MERRESLDSGWVIEQALEILDEVLSAGYGDPIPLPVPHSTALCFQYERVTKIKRLLSRCYAEPISLSELADAVEISVFHLCRIFKAHTGQTIHGYLRKLRLRAGLALLETTDRSLAHLAWMSAMPIRAISPKLSGASTEYPRASFVVNSTDPVRANPTTQRCSNPQANTRECDARRAHGQSSAAAVA